jgi:hypothetical protein
MRIAFRAEARNTIQPALSARCRGANAMREHNVPRASTAQDGIAFRAEARNTIQPRAQRGVPPRERIRGRGGGRYNCSRLPRNA